MKSKQREWEKAFDKFANEIDMGHEELKNFIDSLLQAQQDEAAEMQDEAFHKGYWEGMKETARLRGINLEILKGEK